MIIFSYYPALCRVKIEPLKSTFQGRREKGRKNRETKKKARAEKGARCVLQKRRQETRKGHVKWTGEEKRLISVLECSTLNPQSPLSADRQRTATTRMTAADYAKLSQRKGG